MTDYKQLCAELVDDLELCDWPFKLKETIRADIDRARAALAEPEPPHRCIYSPSQIAECGGPCQQGPEHCDCGELWVTEPEPKEPTSRQLIMLADDMGMTSVGDAAEYARAVLARWGNHPGSPDSSGNLKAGLTRSPAAGEVAELTRLLREEVSELRAGGHLTSDERLRAADLLERLSPPQPVPVSERLPGPGDCDIEGKCWWWYPEVPSDTYGYWAHEDDAVPERALNEQPTHWLSVRALPLPY